MNNTDRYLNIVCSYNNPELTNQLITFFDKQEDPMFRILAGAEAFLKILQYPDLSNDHEISPLKDRLYRKIFKTQDRIDFIAPETIASIQNLYNKFYKKEMPGIAMQYEKMAVDHPNGSELAKKRKLEDSNKPAKAKKVKIRSVHYMSLPERMSRMALFEKGKIRLPQFLQGTTRFDYVMDNYGHFYLIQEGEKSGDKLLKHSSLFAGEAISCAGSLVVGKLDTDGLNTVKYVDNESGHYRPNKHQLSLVRKSLNEKGVSGFQVVDKTS